MGTTITDDPPASASFELDRRERTRLRVLSICLGFGQGCGLCFYVGAGSYYAALFDNSRFFIYYCAFFYIPPIIVSIAAVFCDRAFDLKHGVRVTSKFRIFLSGFAVAVLLIVLCAISNGTRSPSKMAKAYAGEGAIIYCFGSILGIFCSILISASCALLGTVEAGMVPLAILGQTSAGVYTNIVARVIGFAPGAEIWRLQTYLVIASACVLAAMGLFAFFNRRGILERSYQYHEDILASASNQDRRRQFSRESLAGRSDSELAVEDPLIEKYPCCPLSVEASPMQVEPGRSRSSLYGESGRFPAVCWTMAICQALAIAMNMSLTPLANQVAQGDYAFSQTLVLIKLLSDFVGRVVFFLLPQPKRGVPMWSLHSVKVQAVSVWIVEFVRLPLWFTLYARARQIRLGAFSDIIADHAVLLWLVWLPLISLGAMSSSWCCVVAITSASEMQRTPVNVLMASSLYAGFSCGISIALLS